MSQGNPIALKRTLNSFDGIVDEVIYGDLCVFPEDKIEIAKFNGYNMTTVKLPFNYIFENGFSNVLNYLTDIAQNELCLYMNCSEVIDGEQRILELLDHFDKDNYNAFPFDHNSDPHTWYRMWNKSEMKWAGLIHEELIGKGRYCPYYIFRMADTDKDMDDPFKAKVMNDIKELTYFQQYVTLVEHPRFRSITNDYWINFAKDSYSSLKERLQNKGKRYEAFLLGDLGMYMKDALENKEFHLEEQKTNNIIEMQGDKKFLL